MKHAYRQKSVKPSLQKYSIVAVFDNVFQRWRFVELWGLAFGFTAAVIQCTRTPVLLCAIARRWLALPLISFFDDFKLTDLACCNGSGFASFQKLEKFTGFLFDVDKDSKEDDSIIFLGNQEDLSSSASDVVSMFPSLKRLARVRRAIISSVGQDFLPSGAASSVRGQLLSLASSYEGRVGRSQMHHLAERCKSLDVGVWSFLQLHQNLLYHYYLTFTAPCRTFVLSGIKPNIGYSTVMRLMDMFSITMAVLC